MNPAFLRASAPLRFIQPPAAFDTRPRGVTHAQQFDLIGKGLVGFGAPVLGTLTSFLSQLEILLRISSLAVGLAVGIVTLHSLLRTHGRNRAQRNAEQRRRHYRDEPFDDHLP